MATIKAYTDYDERYGKHYYRNFEIIENRPIEGGDWYNSKIIKVEDVALDCEQGNDKVYEYDYYRLTLQDEEGADYKYVAVPRG